MRELYVNDSYDFQGFQKISRLSRPIVITEKIDGTNGQIFISDIGDFLVGSRNRWLTYEDDNHGFYKWAHANKEELMTLGKGHHFGEWWGQGIQGRYSIKEKRFSLFNVERYKTDRPACCHVVPTLAFLDDFDTDNIRSVMRDLKDSGSRASGIKSDKPEGVVIFHSHSNALFKKTFENDEIPKGVKNERD